MSDLIRFAALPAREQLLFLRCWTRLLYVSILLRTRWRLCLFQHRPRRSSPPAAIGPLPIVAAVHRAANYHLKPMLCLERSLTALHLLHRYGHTAALHIGVQPQDTGLKGHAWIELPNQVIPFDDQHPEYAACVFTPVVE